MYKQFNFGAVRPMHYFFSTAIFLGIVFALVTENKQSNFFLHLFMWLLQTVGPIAILVYSHVVLHKLRCFDRQNPWLKLTVSGILGACLFSPFALTIDLILGNEPLHANILLSLEALLSEFIAIAPPITICWIAINAPWVLGFSYSKNPQSIDSPRMAINATKCANVQENSFNENSDNNLLNKEEKQIDGITQTSKKMPSPHSVDDDNYPFYALLNNPIVGELIYLKSELHYLTVVTTQGSELILYNLKDAVEEVPEFAGAMSHRSYWVSFKHINKLKLEGRQGKLIMSNGDSVLISRRNVALFKRKISLGRLNETL